MLILASARRYLRPLSPAISQSGESPGLAVHSPPVQPHTRKRLHIALLLLLAMAFYGGFILMQWANNGA